MAGIPSVHTPTLEAGVIVLVIVIVLYHFAFGKGRK